MTGAVVASATNVMKIYGSGETEVRALDGLNAEFRRGQFSAVMGPSGSGKSTLMHVMAGLDRATSGDVVVGGVDLSTLSEKKLTLLRRDRIGFVFQAYNLVPTLSAEENMVLPLELAGRKPDPEWFNQVVTAVGLGDRLDHRPNELSGGQQQRVAVARAIVSQPGLVLADEPTANLDTKSMSNLMEQFVELNENHNATFVIATHDVRVMEYAPRQIVMRDGKVISDETRI